MHLSIFAELTPDDARRDRQLLLETLSKVTVFGIGSPKKPVADHPILADSRWRATKLLRELHELARVQIGTSGGGNHFAEIVIGEWLTNGQPFVGLLTHSGSRGVGARIANYYAELADRETAVIAKGIPRTYGWLSTEREAGQEYLLAMRLAGDFARANHEVIHARFARALGLKVTQVIENHHNFAWEQPDGTVIHRKGATPAEAGVLGIIPGSMATASYIVEGLGDKATLASAAHGAGRRFSRAEARRTITPAMAAAVVREAGVLVRGLAVDESPLAYKDIESVMEVQIAAGLIRPVARMRPLVVIMSGTAGEDS
jgi:tRNA-splicing ligase RtcB